MLIRRKGRCGVFAGNSVWSTSERVVVEVLTIGAIQVQFLFLSFPFLMVVRAVVSARRAASSSAGSHQFHFGAGGMASACRVRSARRHSGLPGCLLAGSKQQRAGSDGEPAHPRAGSRRPGHLASGRHRSPGQYQVPVPSGRRRSQGCRRTQQTTSCRHQRTRLLLYHHQSVTR